VAGTYCAVGVPISVGGQWFQPTHVWNLTASPYPGNPTTSLTLPAYAPADLLPISYPTAELTVLLGRGGATQCG
jgi:hypothetical protein